MNLGKNLCPLQSSFVFFLSLEHKKKLVHYIGTGSVKGENKEKQIMDIVPVHKR